MNERFVTSLGMSKRLKEAGFPQDTEFWWVLYFGEWKIISQHEFTPKNFCEYYSAFSVPDILEQLTNSEILDYCNRNEAMKMGEYIDLFRSPDKLAEIWLEREAK